MHLAEAPAGALDLQMIRIDPQLPHQTPNHKMKATPQNSLIAHSASLRCTVIFEASSVIEEQD